MLTPARLVALVALVAALASIPAACSGSSQGDSDVTADLSFAALPSAPAVTAGRSRSSLRRSAS